MYARTIAINQLLNLTFLYSQGNEFIKFNGPRLAYDVDYISKSIAAYEAVNTVCDYFNTPYYPVMLPNTISVGFNGVLASKLIDLLKSKVACSAGTTCHAVHEENCLSTVLAALNVSATHI